MDIILLIDDNETVIAAKKRQLLDIPESKVITAKNGEKGIQIAEKLNPSIILLDVVMPEMDGFEVCTILKNNAKTQNIPIIFHTANNDEADILRGLKAGGIDYVNKNANPEILRARITNHLHLIRAQRELRKELHKSRELVDELKTAQNEIKEQQSQLIQSEIMASIGQLAAGVAHEMNNPLSYLSANCETLSSSLPSIKEFISTLNMVEPLGDLQKAKPKIDFLLSDIQDFRDIVEENIEGISRISSIVKNLSEFSGIHTKEDYQEVTINKCIGDVLAIIMRKINLVASCKTIFKSTALLKCNVPEINLALVNILFNSIHSIEEKEGHENGQIVIKTIDRKGYTLCKIVDNGVGIKENIKHKVFEPFFTTKEINDGMGLGLSIAYDIIVNRHQGKISILSKYNHGCICTLSIPHISIKEKSIP